MKLAFDSEKHEYKLDDVIVPSVTQVLIRAGLIDTTWYTEEACERGKAVHKAIHYFDEGDLDISSIDKVIIPYLNAYTKFLDDSKFVVQHTEENVYHMTYNYAGTYDKAGILTGKNVILDIKTGNIHPTTALQLAAYAYCFDYPPDRYALQLKDNGTYKLIHYTDRGDIKTFLAALAVANWKQKEGLL